MHVPFTTVTGITEQDLPKSKYHSGCTIIAIKGRCPGDNIDPRNDDVGFVVFIHIDRSGVNDISSELKELIGTEKCALTSCTTLSEIMLWT